jgi:hypothetical protein
MASIGTITVPPPIIASSTMIAGFHAFATIAV